MTVKTKLLLIESLSQEEGTFLANVDFPFNPIGNPPFPFTVDGVSYVPIMGAWEIDRPDAAIAPVATLVLRIMTQENANNAAKVLKLAQGAGAMRQGASGPVLDLNRLRGDS